MPATRLEPAPATPVTTGLVAVDGRTFPLLGGTIRAQAAGGVAKTIFTQRYANPYAEPLEVLYTLPLPADGAAIGYTIHLGAKIITGRIETREHAAKEYEEALAAGRLAGLLEQERADTFTQRLGSLPPGADVRVEIEVLQPLAFLAPAGETPARWSYRFPTVVGVRYEGAPGRVPDAARLDAERADERGTPARLELELTIADGEPEHVAPQSASHRLRTEAAGAETRVTLESPSPLDRDVVIEWTAASAVAGVSLRVGPGLPGDDGRYGLVTITPPAHPERVFARDLTILIDASGSMTGEPIECAKAAAASLVQSLEPGDRFEVLAFATSVTELIPGPVAATPEAIAAARRTLAALAAGGATEMAQAIERALKPLRADSQRQVILLTDGYIGFENEVVANVLARLPAGARVHTVGIGHAPNRTLTRGAARAGRGVELLTATAADVEAVTARLLKATVAPVLSELAIAGDAVKAVAPVRPRDVLAGQPLHVAVELGAGGGTLEVTGSVAGSRTPWVQRLQVEPRTAVSCAETQLPIGALFGREAIEDEEMRLAALRPGKDPGEILDRIEQLGLRHRITSRRTSLVAISEDPTVDPRDPRRRERLPVELPAGVSAEGVGLRAAGSTMHLAKKLAHVGMAFRGLGASAPKEAMSELMLKVGPRRGVPRPLRARAVRLDGDLLVLELEAPADGIEMPGRGVRVRATLADGTQIEADLDVKLSTYAGRHAAGLTLRIALRTKDGSPWPAPPAAVELQLGKHAYTLIIEGEEGS